MTDCLFCKIIAGTIPADQVLADDDAIAFRDIHPGAPVHVLVVPRRHFGTLRDAARADPGLVGRLMADAAEIAQREGLSEGGYRVVVNTGSDAGQSVHHLHVHVLGGRPMAWPPG